MAQIFLILWDWMLRTNPMRWRLLWALVAAMYMFISMVSNQTVFEFLLTHFSFDQASAYYRVLIWHFGSGSALNHPLFGVGFNRWDRPDWMPGSIDMFWLYHAVLFGIPAGIFMIMSFLTMVFSVGFRKDLDASLIRYRTAFLIAMTGYFLVGWTVHFWNATYVLFLFLLGSGGWLVDIGKDKSAATRRAPGSRTESAVTEGGGEAKPPNRTRPGAGPRVPMPSRRGGKTRVQS
jgi:hypothetical protein